MKKCFVFTLLGVFIQLHLFATLAEGVCNSACLENPDKIIFSPKYENPCSLWRLSLSGDLLWWTAREEGLNYAQSNRALENATQGVSRGESFYPKGDWNIGFKAAAGVTFSEDQWELKSTYTHASFSSTSSAVTSSNPNETLVTQWNVGSPTVQNPPLVFLPINSAIDSADAKWDLAYNTLNLLLCKNYYISKKIDFDLEFGLMGSKQDQDYHLNYYLDFTVPGPVQINSDRFMKQHVNIWGIGPLLGIRTSWEIYKYFHLCTHFATSAQASRFNLNREDRAVLTSSPDVLSYDLISTRWKGTLDTIKGFLQSEIGVCFDYPFSKSATHFLLKLSFESQLWIGQSPFNRRLDESAHGDLSLYGLTIKGKLIF
ncbi:MAG: Lpg1974 family pore-forming outer membrane protein [Simkaniaceae bacterium]